MIKGITTAVLKGANAPRSGAVGEQPDTGRKDDGHSEFNAAQGYTCPDVQVAYYGQDGAREVVNMNPVKTAGPASVSQADRTRPKPSKRR